MLDWEGRASLTVCSLRTQSWNRGTSRISPSLLIGVDDCYKRSFIHAYHVDEQLSVHITLFEADIDFIAIRTAFLKNLLDIGLTARLTTQVSTQLPVQILFGNLLRFLNSFVSCSQTCALMSFPTSLIPMKK